MSSWIVRRKSTGEIICEMFNAELAAAINREKYEVIPILEYLQSINGVKNET